MSAPIDLTGQRFGKLTIIRLLAERNKRKERVWLCQCDCGRMKNVSGRNLRRGYTKSCGHPGCHPPFGPTPIDYTGKVYGEWQVTRFCGYDKHGNRIWERVCKRCGTKRVGPLGSLVNGRSQGCGCRKKDREFETYPVKRGKLTWTSADVCKARGKAWGTLLYANREKRLPGTSVKRYAEKPCRFLGGQKIRSILVRPPYRRRYKKIRVYLIEDLSNYQITRDDEQQADLAKKDWMTNAEIEESFGVSEGFAAYWSKKDSRLRKGEKALAKRESYNAVKQKGSPAKIDEFYVPHVRDILAGKESKHPGSGQGKRAESFRAANPKEVLTRILRECGPVPIVDATPLAKVNRVSYGTVYNLVHKYPQLFRRRGIVAKYRAGRPFLCAWVALPRQQFPSDHTAAAVRQAAAPKLAALLQRMAAPPNGHAAGNGQATTTVAPQRKLQPKKRPAQDKHRMWKRWKDDRMSYAAIAQKHLDEAKEEVTPGAVYRALKRLAK